MNANKTSTATFGNPHKPESSNSVLVDIILNNPESQMRVAIKETEDQVKDETKKRRLSAPSTAEEKIFLNI